MKFDYTAVVHAAANKNDQQAFKILYNKSISDLRKIAFKYMKNESEADDALQETYIHIFTNLSSLKEPNFFPNWAKMICRNSCLDLLRRSGRIHAWEIEMQPVSDNEGTGLDTLSPADYRTDINPEMSIDQQETKRLIGEILSGLPDTQRTCILLWQEQKSTREIAQELGMPEGTVKSNVNYAKKKIREQVLRLEKQGTKLYGLAPIPFFLWLMRQFDTTIKMEAPASGTAGSFASVQNVMNAITQNSVLTGAAVKSAVATAGKAAGGAALSKGAIAAIIVTVAVGGGIGSYAAYSSAAGQQAQETAVISEAESAEEPAMISEAESTVEPAVISEAESTEEPTAVSESAPSENPEDTDYISLYVSKYTELEQTYGKASSTYEYGDYFELIKGLCFAKLADFDEDGIPEMITVHQETDGTNHSVTIDVWGINGNRIINLFNRVKTDSHIVKNHYGSFSELHNSGTNIHVIQLVEAKGKLQMVTDHYSSYESIEYEYGTVKNGVFETHTYRYGFGGEAGPIAPFYIDGAEVSEEEFKESFPYYHYDGLNKSFGFIGHDFKGQYQFSGGDDVSVIYNELEETRKELGLSVKVGPAQDAILQ